MEKKGWKTMAWVFIILFILVMVILTLQMIMKNKKPKWSFESVTATSAKVKFGKKSYDLPISGSGADALVGAGRYTLQVYGTTDTAGVINGARGQLFDTKTGEAVDSPVSITI